MKLRDMFDLSKERIIDIAIITALTLGIYFGARACNTYNKHYNNHEGNNIVYQIHRYDSNPYSQMEGVP